MFSTHLVYYLSLLSGYSRETILASFLILTALYAIIDSRSKETYNLKNLLKVKEFNLDRMLIFLFIFLVSLAILYRSVWFESQTGIVITGSNWQDTPLHYEIIESINNGNFPPQMPYYSGMMMDYHYFVDLHTAILEKVYGFLPKLLPTLNAIFILIFAFSVYSLAKVNGEKEAIFSTVIATFGWGFSFITLFSSLLAGEFSPAVNYAYQYGGFFGLPPIFDNLLQQRPLLVGLPAFALVLNLLRDLGDRNRVILAGIVTGLLFPFHVISSFCCYVAFFVSVVLNLRNFKLHYLYFFVSAIIALPFAFSAGTSASIKELWTSDFLRGNPVLYYITNLGIPFMASLVTLAFPKKVGGKLLKGVFPVLFLIPSLISFAPNPWDMYKFFIFAWIPISVLAGTAMARIKKNLAIVLLLLSVLTSASVIIYNVSTSYVAADWDEYNLGVWVRNNTEEKAVFLTYYSIHSPATMIGGRVRVLSYLNWPYGHGIALDDIWHRVHDVDVAYSGSANDLLMVVEKYNITYIYVGREELANYPRCIEKFDQIQWLKTVYNGSLRVYKVTI